MICCSSVAVLSLLKSHETHAGRAECEFVFIFFYFLIFLHCHFLNCAFTWSVSKKDVCSCQSLKICDCQTGSWSWTVLSACKIRFWVCIFLSLKEKCKYLQTWFISVHNHKWWLHLYGTAPSLICNFANNLSWCFVFVLWCLHNWT